MLKSCETDDTDENKFNGVEYGALTAFSDIIGKYIETVAECLPQKMLQPVEGR